MSFINISIKELKQLLKKQNINIIDIRSPYKYQKGTIVNAKNISVNELLYYTDKYLNRTDKYYLFCDSGSNSARLCQILNDMGYMTYNILGGYNQYLLEK